MTSAVLDAVLCILLVSAAVVTVVDARQQATGEKIETATDPAETVALVSSVTATIQYRERIESDGPERNAPETSRLGRIRHGTLAEVLAFAAVRSVEVDGIALFSGANAVSRVVRETVRRVIGRQTRVVARWDPIQSGHVTGRIAVGPRPPPEVNVHAARLTVPIRAVVGGSKRAFSGTGGSKPSTETVARRAARQFVEILFPPTVTESVLFEGTRRAKLVRQRYERVGRSYGIADPTPIAADRVSNANDRLVAAVTHRFQTDLDRRRSTPETHVGVGDVRIIVRTWAQ